MTATELDALLERLEERHASEYERQAATAIRELREESGKWLTRCAAAISLLPDEVTAGELQEATRAIDAERERHAE